ncbi:hypothetical protein M9H77_03512 [Catharanthus roseus]|uniref:Uncharacterized protein n=1 Tax=Catharanthus roseus TaxID=4058 RepID=A0ACC0CBM7_CATRO|nr:hypothetical protein M9H77_03512 [Catharanthus roseus]
MKSKEYKVTTYKPREEIYMVKSLVRVSGTDNNVYTLRINNKFCNCGKWQTYALPYSHVLAECRENGSRTDTYVPEIYSRQMYKRTYQTNFHPVLSENFWRDVPFSLTFYPPNMKKEQGLFSTHFKKLGPSKKKTLFAANPLYTGKEEEAKTMVNDGMGELGEDFIINVAASLEDGGGYYALQGNSTGRL